jgi:hypothetical protein
MVCPDQPDRPDRHLSTGRRWVSNSYLENQLDLESGAANTAGLALVVGAMDTTGDSSGGGSDRGGQSGVGVGRVVCFACWRHAATNRISIAKCSTSGTERSPNLGRLGNILATLSGTGGGDRSDSPSRSEISITEYLRAPSLWTDSRNRG